MIRNHTDFTIHLSGVNAGNNLILDCPHTIGTPEAETWLDGVCVALTNVYHRHRLHRDDDGDHGDEPTGPLPDGIARLFARADRA